jgi:hypothetical protein
MLGFSSISELAFAQVPGAFIHLSGVNTTGIAGDETVTADAEVSGFSASGSVGTLGDESIVGKANVSITGLATLGELGNALVWGLMIPSPGNSYTSITTGASQSWTEITTGASQTWTDVIQ